MYQQYFAKKTVIREELAVRPQKKTRNKLSKLQRIDQAFDQEFLKTRDLTLNEVPRERLEEVRRQLKELAQRGPIAGIDWEERGPNNVGGRTRAILVDITDASNNTVYAGGVAGGLWKTTNFLDVTPTWTQINDFFDNIAVSAIVQDPNNPSTMYFGTGEGWYNADAVRGLGIWKTVDGGLTWNQLSSTGNSTFYYVQDLLIDRNGVLYASTRNGGLQRSTDEGDSWSQALSGSATDLELGEDGDIYVASGIFSTGSVRKSDFSTYGAATGASGNWLNITPAGSFQRIEMATAPSDSNRVYLLCQSGSGNGVSNIFRSDNAAGNAGITWTSVPVPTIIDQGSNPEFTRGQAWYDLIAAVDPNDEDVVYIAGVDALRSTNAGNNWTQITTWSLFAATGFTAAQNVHADHHAIVFMPGSSSQAIWGTDGGVAYTANANNSPKPSFVEKNTGYNVTQFYACAVSNESTDRFLAGAQDNGTHRFINPGINATTEVTGGDGGFCHIDEDNPNIQISAYTGNSYNITNNAWGSDTYVSFSGGKFINPTDYDSDNNILYTANGTGNYSLIKNVGTTNNSSTTSVASFSSTVSAITVSPNTNHRVFFGLERGLVFRVDDANTTAPSVTNISPPVSTPYCSSIAVQEGDDNHLLVTYSNYGTISVFESTDGGSSWTNVEGNLPDMPVRWAIFNPINPDQALLATEMGVWSTDDLNGSSTNWGATNFNLANTRVDMLQVRASDNLIAAATHGRGLFTTDDFSQARVNFLQGNNSVSEYADISTCPNYTDVQIGIQSAPNLLSADIEIGITVDAATTATDGVDFELLNSTFTYLASGSPTQFFTLRIYDDAAIEAAETVVLNLDVLNPGISEASNGSQLQHVLTIQDDDIDPSTAVSNTAEVGTGDFSLFSASPFRGYYEDERYQTIITADELLNAGFAAGNVTELAFYVYGKGSTQPYEGFSIKLANTSEIDLSSDFSSAATTQVYSADYSTVEGWNNFVFSTPFNWDGTSNLLIETCFNNSSYTSDDGILGYYNSAYMTTYTREDGVDGCAIEFSTYISNYKPYVQLSIGSSIEAEVALNTSQEEALGPNQTVYFYSPEGDIMAKVENLSSHDYGCTTVAIDRAGTGAIAQLGVETTEKAYFITPTNNNPTGSLNVTLYYTEAEIGGFEAVNAGGQSRNDLKIAKSEMSFNTATTATAQAISFTVLPSGILAFTATFADGLSGFTLADGIPEGGGGMLCPTFIVFDNEIIPAGTYQASDYIATQGNVELSAGANVMLEATNVITLSPGFTAASGTTLTIKNTFSPGGDCSTLSPASTVEGRTASVEAKKALNLTFAPNPFRDVANVAYFLPESGTIHLQIYDLNGRVIKTLVASQQQAEGYHQISLSAADWESGLYLLVLKTKGQRITQKIVVMK